MTLRLSVGTIPHGNLMHLLLLNQYGPPDSPPTARLLGELAEFLRVHGHGVEILSRQQSYQGRPARGGGRLRRELAALLSILRAGWKSRNPRPDVVLALSSPPGLPAVGALLAWRHGARLAHWAMDLSPELAVALGGTAPGPVVSLVRFAMGWAYRRAALVVALDEDMRAHLQPLCRCPLRVLEPWPSAAAGRQTAAAVAADLLPTGGDKPPWTWLYSGNLGRAHEWETLLDAQRLLEDRGLPVRLIFQGDGAARKAAQERAEQLGLRSCQWKDYVAEDDLLPTLLDARLLVATQRPETRGLLWPSKLALLERLPRPILYVGPVDGAIARRLRDRGGTGVFVPGQAREVAAWIEDLYRHPAVDASKPAGRQMPSPEEGCAVLEGWLKALLP